MRDIENVIKLNKKVEDKEVIQSKIDSVLAKIELKFLPSLFYK